jgi:hypothetical protein
MSLKTMNKNLKEHKSEMSKRYSMKNDPRFNDLYQTAWISKVMEGYTEVEKEFSRILNLPQF